MMGYSRRGALREMLIVLVLLVVGLAVLWLLAVEPIVEDQRRADFLAEKDPGSFLVPVTCSFFRGTEGKDFVRSLHARPSEEICWYTRQAFYGYFPGLRLADENQAIERQVARMKTDVFRADRAGSNANTVIRQALLISIACAVAIVFLIYVLWRTRKPDPSDDEGGWSWRLRDR